MSSTEQINAVQAIKSVEERVNFLRPDGKILHDEALLKKALGDNANEQLALLKKELGVALLTKEPDKQSKAFLEIQRKAAEMQKKLDGIIAKEYDKHKEEYDKHKEEHEKNIQSFESDNVVIKNILGTRLPEMIDACDPKKNNNTTTDVFFQTYIQRYSIQLIGFKQQYGSILNTKYPQAKDRAEAIRTLRKSAEETLKNLQKTITDTIEKDKSQANDIQFIKDIDAKMKSLEKSPPKYDEEILKALPGDASDKTQAEKKWNYRLLLAYSDAFSTQDTSGESRLNIFSSVNLAHKKNGRNGNDVKGQTDAFSAPSSIDKIAPNETVGQLQSRVQNNPTPEVIHLADVAQYANRGNLVTEMYFSLISRHYLLQLVGVDRFNGNKELRKGLPDYKKKEYDATIQTTPVGGKTEFEWKGVDSDGLDWSSRDDVYKFPDAESEKMFLEGTMKLLPIFDRLGDEYLKNPNFGFLDGLAMGRDIGSGMLKIPDWVGSVLPDILENMIKIGMAVRMPFAYVLGGLAYRGLNDEWMHIPFALLIGKYLPGILDLIASAIPKYRNSGMHAWVKDIRGKLLPDFSLHRATERTFEGVSVKDKALLKLQANKPMYARYQALQDIIHRRMQGPVQIDYKGKTVTLPRISRSFGVALLAMQDMFVEEEFHKKYNAIKDGAQKQAFLDTEKGNEFDITDPRVEDMLIENAFASESGLRQMFTHVVDTSRLSSGPGRIARIGDSKHTGTGLDWNLPKIAVEQVAGKGWRAILRRIPNGIGLSLDPSRIYHSYLSGWNIALARPTRKDARKFLDAQVNAFEISGRKLPLTYEQITSESAILMEKSFPMVPNKDGEEVVNPDNLVKFFSNDAEKALIRGFCQLVNPLSTPAGSGFIDKKLWDYTVARIGFICRGVSGNPIIAEVIGIDTLEQASQYMINHPLDDLQMQSLTNFCELLKTGKTIPPELIMKVGDITGSRTALNGANDDNNHVVGEGRIEMNKIENDYYVAQLEALNDESVFDNKYKIWFHKYAKSCSLGYNVEKHPKLLKAQKKLLEYMKKGGELEDALKKGEEHDHEAALKKKMQQLGVNPDSPGFTQIFSTVFNTRKAALEAVRKGAETKGKRSIETEVSQLDQKMKDGEFQSLDVYKKELADMLRGVQPEKVALDFMNARMNSSSAITILEDAITEYCSYSERIYETRIAEIITSMRDTTLSWDNRHGFLVDYRQYGESSEARGNDRGRQIVNETYDAIHAEIRQGTPSEQYIKYELYKTLVNPEENIDPKKKNTKEALFRRGMDTSIEKHKSNAEEAINSIFNIGRYPTCEQLISNYDTDIGVIKTEYGEISAKMVKDAKIRFDAIKAGHEAAINLCDSVIRGSIIGGKIEKEMDTIKTMHPEYVKIYLARMRRLVDEAKEEYRAGKLAEPIVPPTSENLPPPPEAPNDGTPAAPEAAPQEDVAKLKEAIAKNPIARGVKARFQRAISQLGDFERDVLVNEYILNLKKVSKDMRLATADRTNALLALENPVLTNTLGLPEKTALNQFIKAERNAIAKIIQTENEAAKALEETIKRRRVEAAQLAEKISNLLQGKNSPEAQKEALMALLDGDEISTGQKDVIREFFPEGGSEAVTQNVITGCVHKMIYVSQQVGGEIGEQIANAHSRLMADTAVIGQINLKLKAVNIANIEANVNDSVNIRGR